MDCVNRPEVEQAEMLLEAVMEWFARKDAKR